MGAAALGVEVRPGVRVWSHALYQTTTTVVTGRGGACLVIDPAITAADLEGLARDLRNLGLAAAAGFATHPHWDHVLWCRALGDVPRFAAAEAVEVGRRMRDRLWAEAEAAAPGHDASRFARLMALDGRHACVPWPGPPVAVTVHAGHAPGHAALLLPAQAVLVAGDMLSDVEIPLLDLEASDPLGDYRKGLERLAAAARPATVVVPGHGSVGDRRELGRRLDADRRYLDDLEAGRESADPRLAEPWLRQAHEAQRARLRA